MKLLFLSFAHSLTHPPTPTQPTNLLSPPITSSSTHPLTHSFMNRGMNESMNKWMDEHRPFAWGATNYTSNPHYLTYTFLFERLGECTFLNLGVKGHPPNGWWRQGHTHFCIRQDPLLRNLGIWRRSWSISCPRFPSNWWPRRTCHTSCQRSFRTNTPHRTGSQNTRNLVQWETGHKGKRKGKREVFDYPT